VPSPDADGWSGRYVDALHGWEFMSEAYILSDPAFPGAGHRARACGTGVPGRIVKQRVQRHHPHVLLRESLGALGAGGPLDLYPQELSGEIEQINERVYWDITNGVYRAGSRVCREPTSAPFRLLFDSFDWLEGLLGARRYLTGGASRGGRKKTLAGCSRNGFRARARTESTNLHFRCNRGGLVDYPNMWGYARSLHFNGRAWRARWDGSDQGALLHDHDELNPKHIIPVDRRYDWSDPTGAARCCGGPTPRFRSLHSAGRRDWRWVESNHRERRAFPAAAWAPSDHLNPLESDGGGRRARKPDMTTSPLTAENHWSYPRR